MPAIKTSTVCKVPPAPKHHEGLLRAITECITNLLRAESFTGGLPTALEGIAAAMRLDRMIITEERPAFDGKPVPPTAFFIWASNTAPAVADIGQILGSHPENVDLQAWLAPLSAGHAISAVRRSCTGAVRELLIKLCVVSVLVVPIMVNGKMWGTIAFEDCSGEHAWSEDEANSLKILAEFLGTAITRERYIEELRKANTIVQNSPTILYRLRGEPSFPMIYISQNISLLGYDSAALVAMPTLYQGFVLREDKANVDSALLDMLRKDALPTVIEYRMTNAEGATRWIENRYAPVRDAQGRLVEVEGIMIDITDRKIAEDRIALLARTDGLTALANRTTFNDRLRQAFAACKRGAHPFAVLYLDLDRFKAVNDTYGHPAGDQLLLQVAERLRLITRESDVVARLGGDEFAILQADVTDPAVSGTFAAKIVSALTAPYLVGDTQLNIGASVGIALFAPDTEAPEVLLSQADQALYRAKADGRGTHRFYSTELDEEARDQTALAADLRLAIETDQLALTYRPQVELSSGRHMGMEATVHWNHPLRGVMSADKLMAIGEKAGATRRVNQWILDRVCRQLTAWRAEQRNVPFLAIDVALSQIKLGPTFVNDMKTALEAHDVRPEQLELCVTELILAKTALADYDVLAQLRALGIRIAINDFGEQYSSLNYLRTYHIGRLSISRPMVTAAGKNQESGAMVRAIMRLAYELGIEVIANGIDTDEQRISFLGCEGGGPPPARTMELNEQSLSPFPADRLP